MNKEKAVEQLNDLLYDFENFVEVETTHEDVQALKYILHHLDRSEYEKKNIEITAFWVGTVACSFLWGLIYLFAIILQ